MAYWEAKKRRNVCCFWCCGITAAVLVIIAVVLVILIFVVFKAKDPTIVVDGTTLQGVTVSIPVLTFLNNPLTIQATLDTNLTIHNPNRAGFRYDNTTAYLFYHDEQVAVSPLAAGEVGAKSTSTRTVPILVSLSSNDVNGNLTNDVLVNRMLPLMSTVSIKGVAKIGIFKIKNIQIQSTCQILYFLANSSQTFSCHYKTKL